MEDRRDLDPASPARRTATAAAVPPEAGLGGPGTHGDPAQRDTESPPPRAAAAGHPDTILRWHRDIVRRRWAARSIRGKTGRPATRRNIRALVLRLAAVERRGMRRTGPISRTIAATKRYPVHLGSTRVRRTATARQPIAAGAGRAKYVVPRPSARCWRPKYQPGLSLAAPGSVLTVRGGATPVWSPCLSSSCTGRATGPAWLFFPELKMRAKAATADHAPSLQAGPAKVPNREEPR